VSRGPFNSQTNYFEEELMEVVIFELVFWLVIAPLAFLIGMLIGKEIH
jgi:hypothetical protein